MNKLLKTLFAVSVACATSLALAQPATAPAQATSVAPATPAAGPASPKSLEAKVAMCVGCHGIVGYKSSFPEVYRVPKLAGQSANSAPVFNADPINPAAATEDQNYSTLGLNLATYASDANGGTLTYTKLVGPAWLTIAGNGALSGVPTNADVGSNLFVVRVTDSAGATDDANLRINVVNTNDAPTWNANPVVKPKAAADLAYDEATLSGDAADVDGGDARTFSKVSGPAWLIVAASLAASSVCPCLVRSI